MRKIMVSAAAAALAFLCGVGGYTRIGKTFAGAETSTKLPDFTEDFESYEVSGKFVEKDEALTKKWDNNVFRGGEPLGMDSHIYEKAKIVYENGTDGNKALHVDNTSGADTFFYMGPAGDYRVKKFTLSFRVKFLTEGLENKTGDDKRSWVGISFRKKSNSHYTGTNNLMFTMQRYAESTQVTGHAYAVLGGGSPTDLSGVGSLYGDKLSLERKVYSVPSAAADEATPWIMYTLDVAESRYVLKADGQTIADCTFSIPNYDYFGYLSLNCCTANILVDDFTVSVKDETLPPEILPLPAPVVKLDEAAKKITWDFVDGSGSYAVTVDGKEKTISTNSYSLDRLTAGEHRITVRALSDDTFEAKDSAESNEIVYTAGDSGEPEESEKKKGCKSAAGAEIPLACFSAMAVAGIKRKKNGPGSDKENR